MGIRIDLINYNSIVTNRQLASRVNLHEDIKYFADTSGDWNPFHVDKTFARRLASGEIVVHGISSLLWVLEEVVKRYDEIPKKILCNFLKPILEGEEVSIEVEEISNLSMKILIRSKTELKVFITLIFSGEFNHLEFVESDFDINTPLDRSFEDLKDLSGDLKVSGDTKIFLKNWPSLIKTIGILPVASIVNLSRLVGMYSPGKNSIFSSISLELNKNYLSPFISWSTERHTHKIAPIKLKLCGAGIKGNIEALYRLAPINQESISSLKSRASELNFSGKTALVIGGSRGLGEIVSKLISISGGNVILTFNKGEDDALRVQNEINSNRKSCSTVFLNILEYSQIRKTLSPFAKDIDYVFYFASPKIRATPDKESSDLKDLYRAFYVKGFKSIVEYFLSKVKEKDLIFFYPSTEFIDTNEKKFEEYIIAKTEGEEFCNLIRDEYNNINILSPRLPRLLTDQNIGVSGLTVETTTQIMADQLGNLEFHVQN